mmetsp:Transcript_5509/g.17848  ORF Transcript_5509/g.17848 Transcript_5509/m.17848 type:complete len:213 (+) Transcript_5509:218-856(+)
MKRLSRTSCCRRDRLAASPGRATWCLRCPLRTARSSCTACPTGTWSLRLRPSRGCHRCSSRGWVPTRVPSFGTSCCSLWGRRATGSSTRTKGRCGCSRRRTACSCCPGPTWSICSGCPSRWSVSLPLAARHPPPFCLMLPSTLPTSCPRRTSSCERSSRRWRARWTTAARLLRPRRTWRRSSRCFAPHPLAVPSSTTTTPIDWSALQRPFAC